MNKGILNQRIEALWNETFGQSEVLAPQFFDDIKHEQLLFVGMNPSFSDKGFGLFLKTTKYEKISHHDVFKWTNVSGNSEAIERVIDIDRHAVEKYSYFTKMSNIAKTSKTDWQHVDLFLYRQTNQSEFQKLIMAKNKLTPFGEKQMKLFLDYLYAAKPKCIVVANAKASEIFRNYFSNKIAWDEQIGRHNFDLSGKPIPVLFTSMLSGQRALDRWSFERLDWQIRQILK